jgi:hypothetical protein
MQARVEYPVISMVIDTIADWWKHRSHNDLRSLPASEVGRIAADVGLSEAELRQLDRQSDQPLPLLRMLTVLGLDRAAIKRRDPLAFRDLERCCALCACKQRCARELARGTAAANLEAFCPNALTLKALA